MNKQERELAKIDLDRERRHLADTRAAYDDALKRVYAEIDRLSERDDLPGIRQRAFQESIAEQIGGCLDELRSGQHRSVSEYLTEVYENGFLGSLYSMQRQGIPLAFPIDHRAVAKAVEATADGVKLSKRVYKSIDKLQDQIVAEITRGFAASAHVTDVAERIAYETDIAGEIKRNVKGRAAQAVSRSMTIARTEKGRVQSESQLDAMSKAKASGADIVKQWDSTLDSRTRKDHRKLDGQIRELDEHFEVGGRKAMAPRKFGRAEQDINCRCTMLQRSRAALDIPESERYSKWDGDGHCFVDLSDAKNFADFKASYRRLVDSARNVSTGVSSGASKAWLSAYENETMRIVAEDGSVVDLVGDPSGVSIEPEHMPLLRNADISHTHTTPIGGTFSGDDINVTVDGWVLRHEVKATLHGTSFCIERTASATRKSARAMKEEFLRVEADCRQEIAQKYWEDHCCDAGVPLSDSDWREVDKAMKRELHEWLLGNASKYGYAYYEKPL